MDYGEHHQTLLPVQN